MATDIIMPQMGESIAEGTITKWLKKPGDTVERDEPLFEISTDKVDAEIPAPVSGVLLEIKVPEGETVEVNSIVGTMGAAGEPALGPKQSAVEKPAAPKAATPVPVAPASPAAPVATGTVEEVRLLRSSPVVRKMSAEHGIDIAQVTGTGSGGRVTKKDMETAIAAGVGKGAPVPATAGAPPPIAAPIAATSAAPGSGIVIPDLNIPPFVQGEPVDIEPMSVMRKKIAEHMVYSKTVAAHVTSFFEMDMEEVAKQRQSLKADFAARGAHLTYMPFILRAVTDGLRQFPYLNASVMGDQMVFKKEINLGIAVAINEGKGLIVPVIRNADTLNLFGLSKAINDLGERAKNKQLMPDEVQRGTFSITNPGVYGGLMGTPIINQPQVAILGVGAIKKRPVVINDAIAIRHMCYFTLSYDHRMVDGAMAEMFMAFMKAFLEAGNIQ